MWIMYGPITPSFMMYARSDYNGDLDIVDCGCNFIFQIELKRVNYYRLSGDQVH